MKHFILFIILLNILTHSVAQSRATSVQPITFQSSKTIDVDADVFDIVAANKARKERIAEIKQWTLAKDTVIPTAKLLITENRYKEAITLLSPFEKLNPKDALFYELLGKAYYFQGRYNGAALCLSTSFLIKKNNELIFLIGKSFDEVGNKKESIKWYKRGKREDIEECIDALKGLD